MQITASNGCALFEHAGKSFAVTFHRTLRLPEDGKTHALPPSLGQFPVKLVDDYKDRVPKSWIGHGGVFIPLHQREALWLGFSGHTAAIKVATGKVNAVNGKPWTPELQPSVEDYMVAPYPQHWLDGFNAGVGMIKQFVAMPLGMGYTVEGQLTGKEDFGGLQLLVIPPKPGRIPDPAPVRRGGAGGQSAGGENWTMSAMAPGSAHLSSRSMSIASCVSQPVADSHVYTANALQSAEMGLAAGGQMTQKIYPDTHGIDTWDQAASGRLFVHIVNAEMYEQITGEKPPAMPVSAQQYQGPWYGLPDQNMGDVAAPHSLGKVVKTVGEKDKEHGFTGQQDDSPVSEATTITLPHGTVRDGSW
jgi:hypothetical protein